MKEKTSKKENAIPKMAIPLLGKIGKQYHEFIIGEKVKDLPAFCYVLGKNGLVFKNTNKGHEITRAIKKDELVFFDNIKEETNHYYPAISYDIYIQALTFLRTVFKEHKSEGNVLLLLNHNEPLSKQKYEIYIPKQIVGGASVKYDIEDGILVNGKFLAGSIHSHPDFSAFQSGTDHADEWNFDGIHITLGHIKKPIPDMHQRVCLGGEVYNPKEGVYMMEMTPPQQKCTIPKEWMEQIEKKTYPTYATGIIGFHGEGYYPTGNQIYPSNTGVETGNKQKQKIKYLIKITRGTPINQKSTKDGKLKRIIEDETCKILL